MKNQSIAGQWKAENEARSDKLAEARSHANLTIRGLMSKDNYSMVDINGNELPNRYISLGVRGASNIVTSLVGALWPDPFFGFILDPEVFYDPDVPIEQKEDWLGGLNIDEMYLQSLTKTSKLRTKTNKIGVNFLARQRVIAQNIIVIGDTLFEWADDNTINVFNFEQYVTRRINFDVWYHIIKEVQDPLSFTEHQLRSIGLDINELKEKDVSERIVDKYTKCEWQPQAKVWLITQEVNGNILPISEEDLMRQEDVTPFISTVFELANPTDNYGTGYVEKIFDDLESHNYLRKCERNFAGVHSDQKVFLDESSTVRPEDILAPSGSICMGRVKGGQLQDVAMLSPNNTGNYGVVRDANESIRKDLAASYGLESEVQPQKERVTAYQASRFADEMSRALGDPYMSVESSLHNQLVNRMVYQAIKDKKVPTLANTNIKYQAITGINALNMQADIEKNLKFVQIAQQLAGDKFNKFVDTSILLRQIARTMNIDAPGFVRTRNEIELAERVEMQNQLAMAAGQKAIDVAGNIQENRTTQGEF